MFGTLKMCNLWISPKWLTVVCWLSLFFFYVFVFFVFLCVRVCVYLRMYVHAYLAIPCVSANNNVKHTKSNIRYDNKTNKWNKCKIYKNACISVHRMDVCQQPFSSRQKAEIHKQILNKTWRRWQAMAPHPIPLPCALAFPSPSPSHRDATTPSPCCIRKIHSLYSSFFMVTLVV